MVAVRGSPKPKLLMVRSLAIRSGSPLYINPASPRQMTWWHAWKRPRFLQSQSPKPASVLVKCAQRGCAIDHDGHPEMGREFGIAIQINWVTEGRVGHDHSDLAGISGKSISASAALSAAQVLGSISHKTAGSVHTKGRRALQPRR